MPGQDLVGAAGQPAFDSADASERFPGERAVGVAFLPELQQGILEQRQRAGLAERLLHQLVHQPRLEPHPCCLGRPHDRCAQLVGRHRADDHQMALDLFRKLAILSGTMQKIGAHGEHGHHRAIRRAGRAEEQADERALLLADERRPGLRFGRLERPQLLGLVDHQRQPRTVLPGQQHIGREQQRIVAGAQRITDGCSIAQGAAVRLGQCRRQRVERPRARLERHVAPAVAARQRAALQQRDQPGAHDAALAAARRAQHRQKGGGPQMVEQHGGQRLAPEEAVGVGLLEGQQAQVWGALADDLGPQAAQLGPRQGQLALGLLFIEDDMGWNIQVPIGGDLRLAQP